MLPMELFGHQLMRCTELRLVLMLFRSQRKRSFWKATLFSIGKKRTWLVTIYDLVCTICVLGSASLFLDYVERRMRLQYVQIRTADELDLLGFYLRKQLRFESYFGDEINYIMMGNFSDDVDNYFNSLREEIYRPKCNFAPRVLSIVNALERRRCEYFMEGALFLLRDARCFEAMLNSGVQGGGSLPRTETFETEDRCLILHTCKGVPRIDDVQADVDAKHRSSTKPVVGVVRSTTLPDGVRVCVPGGRQTPPDVAKAPPSR
jgi:hypothetical protein